MRSNCLPGCDRIDGHDGRQPGTCMRDGRVLTLDMIPVKLQRRSIPDQLRYWAEQVRTGQHEDTGLWMALTVIADELGELPEGFRFADRPGWDAYFLGIARAVAARADCSRRQIGAVVVRNSRVIATGYNGAPSGEPGCLTAGACPRAHSGVPAYAPYDAGSPGYCIAIHAEANAVISAGPTGSDGSTLYVTVEPCAECVKMIRASNIARVAWPEGERTYG